MALTIAADHRGFTLKTHIKKYLAGLGISVQDLGAFTHEEKDDFPDFAATLGRYVAKNPKNKGIVLCGSGQGVCIAANKIAGVRAALAWNKKSATLSRSDDNANVLCLGADLLSKKNVEEIISTWLATPFTGKARHLRRLKKITALESKK